MENNKVQMTVTIDPKLKKSIEKKAKSEGRTTSNWVDTHFQTFFDKYVIIGSK